MKPQLFFALNQAVMREGAVLRVGLGQVARVSGSLMTVALSQRNSVAGAVLRIGLGQMNQPKKRRFSGDQAIGIGDYDIEMTVDGLTFDMCELADSITITHGENEAYTCEFVIQKPINPRSKDGIEVDLYQWYGRKNTINIVHDAGVMRLYHGTISSVQPDFSTGKIRIGCTDMRQRLIDALPKEIVAAIGYTSKSAHGEFDNLSDELNKRLETVPASFEFDVYGNGYLNWWLPEKPKRTIDGCLIYMRQPSARLAQVGEVVNRVNVALTSNFSRLFHRSVMYNYAVDLGVCQYQQYGKIPSVKDMADAVSQTGWALNWFDFTRVVPSGWYDCGGSTQMGFMRDRRTAELKEDGSYSSITVTPNLDVVSGNFEMTRRWIQSVGYVYDLVYQNSASVGRYGELAENISFRTEQTDDEKTDDWTSNESPHKNGLRYKFDAPNDIVSDGIYLGSKPFFNKKTFNKASNGDWYTDVGEDVTELQQTLLVAYHTARTKMWASHRQNTVDVQIKFLPEISLRDSHQIEFKHVSGLAKVAHFVHHLDLLAGLGSTDIQYRFFQSPDVSQNDDGFILPKPPESTFAQRSSFFTLRRLELNKDEEVKDKHFGVLYRPLVGRLYQPLGVRLYAPEIEEQSTDSAEFTRKHQQEIHIPNNKLVFRM